MTLEQSPGPEGPVSWYTLRKLMVTDHRWRRALSLATLAIFCVPAPLAQAGVSVSPTRVVHQGKPKQVIRGAFTVTNTAEEPIEVRVEPEDWAGGISGKRDPVPWLRVKPTRVKLKPGKPADVKYTIRIPKDASGELRTQVFFSTGGAGTNAPRARLGAILYIAIEGTERLAASIGRVHVYYTAATEGAKRPDRLEVVMRIYNGSNVHIVPEGEVLVRDAKGRVVATVPLPAGWGLLPNEEDKYHAIGHGVHLQPGTYTINIRLQCGQDLEHPITVTKDLEATVNAQGHLKLVEPQTPTPPSTPATP